jgi:hypothetical protein
MFRFSVTIVLATLKPIWHLTYVMLCFWKGMTMFVSLHLQDYFGGRILLVGDIYVMREILLHHVAL